MENMNERTAGDHIVAQALETALGSKVEKEEGKGLSSNDYTDAEKEKLAGLENYTLPDFTYRNLCMNSRGDNLNCWSVSWGTSTLTKDYDKFGYPVLCVETTMDGAPSSPFEAIAGDDNIPSIREIIGHKGGAGLLHDIVISYDIYSESATTVYEGCHEPFPHLPYTAGTQIKANQWHRIVSKVPAGTVWDYFILGYIRDAYIGHKMYMKNIQIEYGTEATPYCYNPTLPFSLEEQIVPGEFWDGKQVYVRSFKGTTPASLGTAVTLMTGIDSIVETRASIATLPYNSVPPASIYDLGTITMDLLYLVYSADSNAYLSPYGSRTFNAPYTVTMNYTKA